jgi:type I restriction enzyme S subunit
MHAETPSPVHGPFSTSWPTEAIGDVVQINPESRGNGTPTQLRFRYIDISSVNHGVIDWASVSTQTFASAPSRARRVVRPGDVLLCTVRPGLQSHTFAGWSEWNGYICPTGFTVLRCTTGINPRYLYHLVFSDAVATQIRRIETGSNYPAINESDVRVLRIPFPPYVEQRRIAEVLDTVEAAIQQSEALIAKLKQMKAGLLHDLLTRGLDEHGRLRDPVAHPEQFKDTPVGGYQHRGKSLPFNMSST